LPGRLSLDLDSPPFPFQEFFDLVTDIAIYPKKDGKVIGKPGQGDDVWHKIEGIDKIKECGDSQENSLDRYGTVFAHGISPAKSYKCVHTGTGGRGVCACPVDITSLLEGLKDKSQKPASSSCNGSC